MTTPAIIDAIAAAILIGFCVWGAHRGLLRSLAGLVILVVSLVGAAMLATTFAPGLTSLVTPIVEKQVAEYVSEAAEIDLQLPEAALPAEAEELLVKLGLDEDLRRSLMEQAEKTVVETGADAATAVVMSIVHGLVYAVLFVLFFAALTVLLHVLLGAMDLVLKLPGLHLLNSLGGALVGLVQGALALFLAVWVLRRFGVSFDGAMFADTYLLHIFTTYTPLSVLSVLM